MLNLTIPPFDPDAAAHLVGSPAAADHVQRLVDEPCAVTVEGDERPVGVLGRLSGDWAPLAAALRAAPRPSNAVRTAGMMTRSRTFGSLPRSAHHRMDSCRACPFNTAEPAAYAHLQRLAKAMATAYRTHRPDVYANHQEQVREVHDAWRLPDGPFTSGIINYESSLTYHRDRGNYPDSWNVQATFRDRIDGGLFVVPSWGLAFDLPDQSFLLLDAQSTVHGCTQPRRLRRDGYRISVVFYSTRLLRVCGSPDEEIAHGRRKRTEREMRMAGLD